MTWTRPLKSAFGFVFAIWGAFWFILIVFIFTVLYKLLFLFTKDRYVRQCVWFNCHYLCNLLLLLCFVRKNVYGRHLLDENANYVFVCNHTTQFDTIVAASSVPHAVSFVAKSELLNIPFFGTMVKMLAIPVDRKDKKSRGHSLRRLLDHVARGYSVFLYPEGTRNKTDEVLIPFKDGAFSTAILTKTPIVIMTLVGMKKINEAKGLQLFPGTAEVYFSAPIETAHLSTNDLDSLKLTVANEMKARLLSSNL